MKCLSSYVLGLRRVTILSITSEARTKVVIHGVFIFIVFELRYTISLGKYLPWLV